MIITKLKSTKRVTQNKVLIPQEVRELLCVRNGDLVEFEIIQKGNKTEIHFQRPKLRGVQSYQSERKEQ